MMSPAARYARLLRLCRRMGCPREIAKELVQEAPLNLFQYQQHTRVRNAPQLLRRIALNLSCNYHAREPSGRFRLADVERLNRRGTLVHPAPGPERTIAAEQQLDEVFRRLSAVSARAKSSWRAASATATTRSPNSSRSCRVLSRDTCGLCSQQ